MSGAWAERSGERALQKNDGAERSAEREVAKRERSVERAELAAHSPLQRNISLILKVYHNVVSHSLHSTVHIYTSTVISLNITQPKAF